MVTEIILACRLYFNCMLLGTLLHMHRSLQAAVNTRAFGAWTSKEARV